MHYIDGKSHNENDLPNRMGLWWIGMLAMTKSGNKAFFNVLNVNYGTTIMKLTSPFNAPIPSCQYFGDSGVTNVHDPRLIYTYICSVDVNAAGEFVNIKQLPPVINRGGVNFVYDIDNDGRKLYVNHMDITEKF